MLTSKTKFMEKRPKSSRSHAVAPTQAHAGVERRTGQQSPALSTPELCFIRLNEVLSICGKSRSSVYESIKNGNFPAPVKVGGRSSAWVKREVLEWAQNCVDVSRGK